MNHRQIIVDGSPVGMLGLDDVFAALKREGFAPGDERLDAELVARLGRDNYIPYGARDVYGAALSREYAAYASGDSSSTRGPSGYGTWRGHPREQIPWYPTVDEDLCDGCGRCLRICASRALAATKEGKVAVVTPFACVVGCSSCARLCPPGAILFPPREILEAYGVTR